VRITLKQSTHLLTAILALVTLGVIAVTIYELYTAAIEEQRARLTESVQSQARLMEAVARFDSVYSQTDVAGSAEQATLTQIREAHAQYQGAGITGEFTLAKLDNHIVRFLLRHRNTPRASDPVPPKEIRMGSSYAEPMQLALSGKSGTVIARDYRGALVLAAYEPVAVLSYGVVAKVDMAEIRAPFVRAAVVSALAGTLFIVIGAIGFHFVTQPLIRRLEESEESMRLLLESNGEAIYGVDTKGFCTFANPACVTLLGYDSADELVGRRMHELIHHSTKDGAVYPLEEPQILPAFKEEREVHIDHEVLWRKDGTSFPGEYSSFPIIRTGHCTGAVVSFTDITERLEHKESQRLAATVFENVADGLMITDANANIVSVNRAFTEITGYTHCEAHGKNPRLLKSGRHETAFYNGLWQALNEEGSWKNEIWNRRKNGEIFPMWEAISAVQDSDGQVTHYVAVFSDISGFKKSEERLQYLAHHDPLTDLPNRLLFNARCALSMQNAARKKSRLGILFMDLDRFKPVNDLYGHECGDEVLKMVGARLVSQIRKGDSVCRMGGDEFAVLLTDIKHPEIIDKLARNLVCSISQPMQIAGKTISISCSMGISVYPQDGEDMDTLLSKADSAMYNAKRSGESAFISTS